MQKAVGYVRVSTQGQADEGVSLEAQNQKIRTYCELQGFELVAIYGERNGVSGYSKSLAERSAGRELLSALEKGEATHVVAHKIDRLFRDAVDCLETSRVWEQEDISLHIIDLGGQAINTRSASGRFFLTVMAGVAEMERNLISERTRVALDHKRDRGEWASGRVPYGWRINEGGKLEEDTEQQVVIQKIKRARRRGRSFREIAAAVGLPLASVHRIATTDLRSVRRRYAGEVA